MSYARGRTGQRQWTSAGGSAGLLAVVLLLLPTVSLGASTAAPGLKASVDAGNLRYLAAMRRGDARAFAALFDVAAIEMSPGEALVRGRSAIAAQYTHFFAKRRLTAGDIHTWYLERSVNTAYELGTYRFAFSGKPALLLHGHYCTIWKRQPDGRWKIAVDIAQPDPPARN